MKESTPVVRYSDAELQEFKVLIEQKLEKANAELELLMRDLYELNDDEGSRLHNLEDGHLSAEREYLSEMANRQKKFIRDLENALIRIKNKTYGVCSITGELIDKRRLMAVPHTTKSVAAKSHK